MQTWSSPRSSLAERFWSLAEAAERAPADRSHPVGVVRHILDILAELGAGWSGEAAAPSTRAFLAELEGREARGDLAYVAPERAAGDPPDERTLVYAVGVLLLEGLAGREVPPALRGVLVRATCADPAERFASVAALAAELEWFVITEEDGVVVLASAPTRSARVVTLPAVVVDPRALVPSRPPSVEMQLETALVPKLTLDELAPSKRRVDRRRTETPRRSQPSRRRRREAVRLAAFAFGFMLASAAATALIMLLLRR